MIRATPIMETLTGFMIAGFIVYSGKLIAAGELGINNFFFSRSNDACLSTYRLSYDQYGSLPGSVAFKRIEDIITKEIMAREIETSPKLKIIKSEIKFKNVNFKYETTKEKAIKDVSLDINGNTMVAFVGHSGAGKSTIINLLPRFYDPQSGTIEIDGQDIKKVSLMSLRKNISMVSQDVILFDDTIRNNITYANNNANEEALISA